MKVKINKPCRVNLLSGEIEVTKAEADRLFLLGLAEPEERETRIITEKETKTRKTKK